MGKCPVSVQSVSVHYKKFNLFKEERNEKEQIDGTASVCSKSHPWQDAETR